MIVLYHPEGAKALERQGAGGRYHESLTPSEEHRFLAPFFERAEAGALATTRQIDQAFAERVGTPVHETTVDRLLTRHGWGKLMA